ncbi:DUF4870 domain-containing protein [Wenyingzhuangia marina]|uniref:DUF4870 domain-containing protein n=1 Tax=Wenyingzhuangia marina TaxID=1195760 RepID=A0A1M5WDZ2_9FLAO|nr:DUF4870 domain-containing protein [Wenyingzhuangia marina]GGF81593.1 hypothetical protein GCM10011397_25710 [Wenyingzhuangia marina]SHH85680.1 hypothetical protein SAMN05444281_2345 [Wenyingzhuangia marina]
MIDTRTEKTLAIIIHLSIFLSGFLPIVIPLVIWLLKKDESQFINEHGKSALNFQLTMLIVGAAALLFSLFTFGLGAFLMVPLAIILGVLSIIFVVIAAINASGGQLYKYPISLELIK